ncbi:MAG: isopentenyl-diphosphate Delta-isomerase [Luteibaculaceae bacterium]
MEHQLDYVVLVDDYDNEVGTMEKLEAHEKGLLHRAFSLFIFNTNGEMLLQQRAATKYHSPNLWTNACCSHPRPKENLISAIKRRTLEEINLSVEPEFKFTFIYKADFDNGLMEYELDHVYFAITDKLPIANPNEVQGFRYATVEQIAAELKENPEQFTAWFKICFLKVKSAVDTKTLAQQ